MYYIDGPTGPRQKLFERRIKQSGRRKTVCDVYYNNQLVKSDIKIIDGVVNISRGSAIRRTASITVADPTLSHGVAETVMSPYGTEVHIRHGIVYPDKTEELIPVGVFIIDATNWEEGPFANEVHHTHTLELVDRAMIMERSEIGPPLSYAGVHFSTVIQKLMSFFWPDLPPVVFGDGLMNLRNPGGTVFTDGNHWDVVSKMANNMGGEIYFDILGQPTVAKLPQFSSMTTNDEAVWTVSGVDREFGTLMGANRSITREGVYNWIYVVGQAQENQPVPIGLATNANPSSPTYIYSPFRKIQLRIENNEFTTADQCQIHANAMLAEHIRLSKTLAFTTMPNPLIDAGDIVLLEYPTGETEVGLIESISLPLRGGVVTGQCSGSRI